jgi:rubredoxin
MSDRSDVDDSRCCPMCGYAMRGLPAMHKCPECGFDCDPHAAVFWLKTHAVDVRSIFLGVLLVSAFVWGRTTGRVDQDVAAIAVLAVAIGWHVLRAARRAGAISAIVVNRSGCITTTRGGR